MHLAVNHVLAVAPVTNIDRAADWYERLLGRAPGNRPMDSLASLLTVGQPESLVYQDVEPEAHVTGFAVGGSGIGCSQRPAMVNRSVVDSVGEGGESGAGEFVKGGGASGDGHEDGFTRAVDFRAMAAGPVDIGGDQA